MNTMKYECGDIVTVRSVGDLTSEFGNIGRIGFMDSMKVFCGKTFRVASLAETYSLERKGTVFYLEDDSENSPFYGVKCWLWSSSMVRPAEEVREEERVECIDVENLLSVLNNVQ